MISFTDLNTFGQTAIETVDNRLARVRFDLNYPTVAKDQLVEVTNETEVLYPEPGINILEVINPNISDVRYRVSLSGSIISKATITWPGIPGGITLSEPGPGVYELSGIETAVMWNQIKDFVINFSTDITTEPYWFVEAAIIYFDEQAQEDKRKNWLIYDPNYFHIAEFTDQINLECSALKLKIPECLPLAEFSMTCNNGYIRGIENLELNTLFVMSAEGITLLNRGVLSAQFSLVADFDPLFNLESTKLVYTQDPSPVFVEPYPVLQDGPDGSNFTITLTSTIGQFYIEGEPPNSTWTYTGSREQINAIIPQIKFIRTGAYTDASIGLNIALNGVSINEFPTRLDLVGQTYYLDGDVNDSYYTTYEGNNLTVAPSFSVTSILGQIDSGLLEFDVSQVPGTQVVWTNQPTGSSVTNPSPGIYRIQNFTTAYWVSSSRPQIRLTSDFNGVLLIPVKLIGLTNYEWTVHITVNDQVVFITDPSTVNYTPDAIFNVSGPQFSDPGTQNINWTATIRPTLPECVTTITSNSGFPTSFDSVTKTLSYSGNSTSMASFFSYSFSVDTTAVGYDFELLYYAYNSDNPETGYKEQNLRSNNLSVLTAVRAIEEYTPAELTSITGGPQLVNNGSGTYTMNIVPVTPNDLTTFTYSQASNWSYDIKTPTDSSEEGTGGISADGNTRFFALYPNVYIYYKSGNTWTLQTTLTLNTSTNPDRLSLRYAISADGNTFIFGDQNGGVARGSFKSGIINVYKRSGGTWSFIQGLGTETSLGSLQTPYFLSNTGMAVSSDGLTIAGCLYWRYVIIWTYSSNTWSIVRTIDLNSIRSNSSLASKSGICFSANSTRLALAAYSTVGSTEYSSIFLFNRVSGTWGSTPSSYIDRPRSVAFGTGSYSHNSSPIAISSTGASIVVVEGIQYPNAGYGALTTKVYTYSTSWQLQQSIPGTYNLNSDVFMSSDATRMIISQYTLIGIQPTFQLDEYVYSGSSWSLVDSGYLIYETSKTGWQISANVSVTSSLITPVWGNMLFSKATTAYDSLTKTITFTGTYKAVNTRIDTIQLISESNLTNDLFLSYTGITPTSSTQTKIQRVKRI